MKPEQAAIFETVMILYYGFCSLSYETKIYPNQRFETDESKSDKLHGIPCSGFKVSRKWYKNSAPISISPRRGAAGNDKVN